MTKMNQLSVGLSDDIAERLEGAMEKEHCSAALIVRKALRLYFKMD